MPSFLQVVKPMLSLAEGEWPDLLVNRAIAGAMIGGAGMGLYEWGMGGSFWSGAARGAVYGAGIGGIWGANEALAHGISRSVSRGVAAGAVDEILDVKTSQQVASAMQGLNMLSDDAAEAIAGGGAAAEKASQIIAEQASKLDISRKGFLDYVKGRGFTAAVGLAMAEGVDPSDPSSVAQALARNYVRSRLRPTASVVNQALAQLEGAARAAAEGAGQAAANAAATGTAV